MAEATQAELDRFRRKLFGTPESMPDPYVQSILTEAEERYPVDDYPRPVQLAYAYVLGVRDLIIRAAYDTDYRQNESEEKRSQTAVRLEKLEAIYQKDLNDLLAEVDLNQSLPPVMFGSSRRVPSTVKEYPDGLWTDDERNAHAGL